MNYFRFLAVVFPFLVVKRCFFRTLTVVYMSHVVGFVQNYFGCFFSLPIVITSMRWGIAAGRKTMVCKWGTVLGVDIYLFV